MSHLKTPSLVALHAAALVFSGTAGAQSVDPGPVSGPVYIGSLEELRQRVMDANWSIQSRIMDYKVRRRTQEAAKGAFDPQFKAGYDYADE